MKTRITTAQTAKSVRKSWGFRATSRIHGDGKQTKGFNRTKENRQWRKNP